MTANKKFIDIYVCDNCKKDIPSDEVLLVEPAENVQFVTPMPFVFMDKNGKPVMDSHQPRKENGDKVLACPHCNYTHLFGFNLKS